jgi:CBS domain-containing protein
MKISSLCTREPVTIDRSASLEEAAGLMRDRHVGYLVVTDTRRRGRAPVGVLTDRDIVIKVLAKGVDTRALSVGDVMTADPVVTGENDELPVALQRMRSLGVRRLPIVGLEGQLKGVLSLDDVVDSLASELTSVAGSIRNELTLERQFRT